MWSHRALFLTLIQRGQRRRLGRPLCCDCSQRLTARLRHATRCCRCLFVGEGRK